MKTEKFETLLTNRHYVLVDKSAYLVDGASLPHNIKFIEKYPEMLTTGIKLRDIEDGSGFIDDEYSAIIAPHEYNCFEVVIHG